MPVGSARGSGVSHLKHKGKVGKGIRNRCECGGVDSTAAPCLWAAILGSASPAWFGGFAEQMGSLWPGPAPPAGNLGHCISRNPPALSPPPTHTKFPLSTTSRPLPSQARDSRRCRPIQALPAAPGGPGDPALLADLSENTQRVCSPQTVQGAGHAAGSKLAFTENLRCTRCGVPLPVVCDSMRRAVRRVRLRAQFAVTETG